MLGGGLGPSAGGAGLLCSLRGVKQPELPLPCSKGPQSDTGGQLRLRGVPGTAAASAPSLLGGCAGGSPSPGLLQPSPPPRVPQPSSEAPGKSHSSFSRRKKPTLQTPPSYLRRLHGSVTRRARSRLLSDPPVRRRRCTKPFRPPSRCLPEMRHKFSVLSFKRSLLPANVCKLAAQSHYAFRCEQTAIGNVSFSRRQNFTFSPTGIVFLQYTTVWGLVWFFWFGFFSLFF